MRRWWMACLLTGCVAEYELASDPASGWGQDNPSDVPGTERVDRIKQVVAPVIDSLFVIDSSPSMADDRRQLAAAFPKFIAPFEEAVVDWHVGVITTDMQTEGHKGKLQERGGVRWLQSDTPDFDRLFTIMATTIQTPVSEERGREAAWTALELERDGFNAGFLRDDEAGYLHVTIVTDEDDDTDDQVISIAGFAGFIDVIKPYPDRTTFNSVVALKDDGPEQRGSSYMAITAALGGEVFNVNTRRWTGLLEDLAALQAPEPQTEFFLSALPIPETLDVIVVDPDGVTIVYVQEVDYVWDRIRNSVQFLGEPPRIGSQVEITYTIAAD